MVCFPNAKINLGLHVVARRPDGYHSIETCFFPIPWQDILEIIPAKKTELYITGAIVPGDQTDNLCLRAFQLFEKEFKIPAVDIRLHKIIPTGAGLGGGSSDAAYTLRTLAKIFSLNITPDHLNKLAATLGSDCAFFLHDTPCLGSGRGEILTPFAVSLSGKYLVVVKPNIHVSTAEAFNNIIVKTPDLPLNEILSRPVSEWRKLLVNDFEYSVFRKHPAIALIKEIFYAKKAIYASMSGSGSSVFGIFDHMPEIDDMVKGCEYWSGLLR